MIEQDIEIEYQAAKMELDRAESAHAVARRRYRLAVRALNEQFDKRVRESERRAVAAKRS